MDIVDIVRIFQAMLMKMQNETLSMIKEECRITKIENLKNIERLENTIPGPEGRLKSGVDQHCCKKEEMESRILSLKQERVKDSHINAEQTRSNIDEEIQIIVEDSLKKKKRKKIRSTLRKAKMNM